MPTLTRPSLMLITLMSLSACNKPQVEDRQTGESPAPPPEIQPAPPPTVARSLTISSIFIDPKIATICGMVQPKAYFDFDSAVVEAADDRSLATLAQCATSGPLKGRKLDLIGHTDPRGTDEYNAKLGRSRSQAIADYLTKEGMVASTMTVKSEGEQGADPGSPEEWSYDRRVDIRLAD